jgi:hypothetical protein
VSRQTNAHVRARDGSELLVQENQSDAPTFPIAAIERLHKIRPDRVDWVFEQTQAEAQARRIEQHRINTFVFFERIAALVTALIVGLCGVGGGIYAAIQGHEWLGGIVATAMIGTLAVAFLRFRGK